MKVLFLDIDGVMNSVGSSILARSLGFPNGGYCVNKEKVMFCPIAVSNMQWLLAELPELKIVISSTWRLTKDWDYLLELFEEKAGIPKVKVIGRTPVLPDNDRGDEIQKWLDKNGTEVEAFAIVDDDSDMCHLKPYLIQTSSYDGLTFTKASEIKKKLEVK